MNNEHTKHFVGYDEKGKKGYLCQPQHYNKSKVEPRLSKVNCERCKQLINKMIGLTDEEKS